MVKRLALVVIIFNVPFPIPDADDKISQSASVVTVQFVFEVTSHFSVAPDNEATVIYGGVTINVGSLTQRTDIPTCIGSPA